MSAHRLLVDFPQPPITKASSLAVPFPLRDSFLLLRRQHHIIFQGSTGLSAPPSPAPGYCFRLLAAYPPPPRPRTLMPINHPPMVHLTVPAVLCTEYFQVKPAPHALVFQPLPLTFRIRPSFRSLHSRRARR